MWQRQSTADHGASPKGTVSSKTFKLVFRAILVVCKHPNFHDPYLKTALIVGASAMTINRQEFEYTLEQEWHKEQMLCVEKGVEQREAVLILGAKSRRGSLYFLFVL